MNIFLEYIIVFIALWIMNYFAFIKNKVKYSKKNIPIELTYLKKLYNVKIKKEDYKKFLYTYTTLNCFIISTIYIIIMYLIHNWPLRIILGIILLVLLTIICYGLLGRYYIKKEGEK